MLYLKSKKERMKTGKYVLKKDDVVLLVGDGDELLAYFNIVAKSTHDRSAKVQQLRSTKRRLGYQILKRRYTYELYYNDRLIEEADTLDGIASKTGYSTAFWNGKFGEEHDGMIVERLEVYE